MEKCLVFFDVDGTLLFDNRYMSSRNVDAIKKVKDAGHEVFINSGRSRSLMGEVSEHIEFDGFICGSSYVEYHGEILNCVRIDGDTLLAIAKYCVDNHIKCIFEGEEKVYKINGGVFHEGIDLPNNFESFSHEWADMKITKITFDRCLEESVGKLFPKVRIINFSGYSEAITAGYSKSWGMKLLSEKLGIPSGRMVAFGDSINDVEMLEYAGKSVIMKSAPAFLDKIATMRVDSDEDGVAIGIDKIFFGE